MTRRRRHRAQREANWLTQLPIDGSTVHLLAPRGCINRKRGCPGCAQSAQHHAGRTKQMIVISADPDIIKSFEIIPGGQRIARSRDGWWASAAHCRRQARSAEQPIAAADAPAELERDALQVLVRPAFTGAFAAERAFAGQIGFRDPSVGAPEGSDAMPFGLGASSDVRQSGTIDSFERIVHGRLQSSVRATTGERHVASLAHDVWLAG